jgi:hypothetical protein
MLEAAVTRSKSTDALVGAAGTKAKCLGWSIGMVALTNTSLNNSKAFSPPMPFSFMVSPTNALRASSFMGFPSSGFVFVILPRTYFIMSMVISTTSMSILCM